MRNRSPTEQSEPLPFGCAPEHGGLAPLKNLVLYRNQACNDSGSSSSSSIQIQPLASRLNALLNNPLHNPREHTPLDPTRKNLIAPCITPERLRCLIGNNQSLEKNLRKDGKIFQYCKYFLKKPEIFTYLTLETWEKYLPKSPKYSATKDPEDRRSLSFFGYLNLTKNFNLINLSTTSNAQ